jgi:multidrug efflux pump subunit AcrB
MLALGFSANTVSLLALVLAIGIVVDDAIVVVEAVEAHLEKDHTITPAEAARRAMKEITAPIPTGNGRIGFDASRMWRPSWFAR